MDNLRQLRPTFYQVYDDPLKLISIQIREHLLNRWHLLDLLRGVKAGKQYGDDVLAIASPVIRTGAIGEFDAVLAQLDGHSIGVGLAAHNLGQYSIPAPDNPQHRSRFVIVVTSLEGSGARSSADDPLGELRPISHDDTSIFYGNKALTTNNLPLCRSFKSRLPPPVSFLLDTP